jgi:hypothetical protein
MNRLDIDLDSQMTQLEREWRTAYEGSIVARADYQRLAARGDADADALDRALERLDRAEALKAGIMVKIERLEQELIGRQP